MTQEKFSLEVKTLLSFFHTFCKDKHPNMQTKTGEFSLEWIGDSTKQSLVFSNAKEAIKASYSLCPDCLELLLYALARLQHCPHDPKPRCRFCKAPCYEKSKFKDMAKMMRYSGVKLGLSKLKGAILKLKYNPS